MVLSEPERQELTRAAMLALVAVRAGLTEIDASLGGLSDDELRVWSDGSRPLTGRW